MTPLLELDAVSRRYSGLLALDRVDMRVPAGGIHAVIGPNGAGKTTLFNLISGVVAPSGGRIRLGGEDVTHLPAHRRARLGLPRTFQNIRVFGAMTVLENVLTGLHPRLRAGLPGVVLRLPRFRAEERAAVARAREMLELVGLGAHAGRPAGTLSYGDQRRLEIARAMCTCPVLLCLDEPAAGLNPRESAALDELLLRIRDGGCSVLLIEHDMGVVMRVSDHVVVLDHGQRISDGAPAAVRQDPAVIAAYLGTGEEDEAA